MRKIICLFFFAMAYTAVAHAKVVELESKNNIAPAATGLGITTISTDLGRSSSPGDYGVFVRVEANADDENTGTTTNTFFFRPVDGEIKRDGDSLYMVDKDGTTRIADKRIIGWKTVPGVKLLKHVQRENRRLTVDVPIQIN